MNFSYIATTSPITTNVSSINTSQHDDVIIGGGDEPDYDYDYDYGDVPDMQIQTIDMKTVVPVVYSVIFAVGLLGNGLVLYILMFEVKVGTSA